MGITVNVLEAKTRLSELLRRVEAGEEVTIARSGVPIAQLCPVQKVDLVFGGFDVHLADDFFAPMDLEDLAMWDGADVEPSA